MHRLSRTELEFLKAAIKRRQLPTPLTEMALQSVGKGKLYARLGALAGAAEPQALALIDAALGEGAAAPKPSCAAAPKPQLLWTGPEPPAASHGAARGTTPALLELLGEAKERVIVAGYEFDYGGVLFAPLHKAMAERGVRASIFLDICPAPSPSSKVDAYLALEARKFLSKNWPFGAPYPELYYFPDGAAFGSRESFHAKCVVVDGLRALVGSANFTRRGHSRNVEVGAIIDDEQFAAQLAGQFDALVAWGKLAPLPVAAVKEAPPFALEDDDASDTVSEEAREGGDGTRGAEAAFEALADELMVADEARDLLVRLLADGHPRPEVGDDIESETKTVLGSAELSWPERRVAVLLPEQEACAHKLEAAGWVWFSPELGPEEMQRLAALLSREG